MKNFTIIVLGLFLLNACSTTATTETKPSSIYINSTGDLENCKYLGAVESKNLKEWKEDFRKQAGEKGATHILSSGPNGVTGSQEGENVTGNAYFCKK